MEYFDILDENEGFTGKTISREEAHKSGTWHLAVALYIINSKRQVLMQKRSRHKKIWPSCWDFACGGHVEAHELGLATVIREAYEELATKIKPSEVRYICNYRSTNENEKMCDRHHNEYYIAFKDVDISKVKLQENEVEEIKWVDYNEFKRMVANKDSTITSKWEAHEALIRYFDKYGYSQK